MSLVGLPSGPVGSWLIAQSESLSLHDRKALEDALVVLRLRLLEKLHGQRFQVEENCSHCNSQITSAKVISELGKKQCTGTILCDVCNEHFVPQLLVWRAFKLEQIPFYCSSQTLEELSHIDKTVDPQYIIRMYPEIYHAAIIHFGLLRKAYYKVGVRYTHEETLGWQKRIRTFLGCLPDAVIAHAVGADASAVHVLRKRLGKPQYTDFAAAKSCGIISR